MGYRLLTDLVTLQDLVLVGESRGCLWQSGWTRGSVGDNGLFSISLSGDLVSFEKPPAIGLACWQGFLYNVDRVFCTPASVGLCSSSW